MNKDRCWKWKSIQNEKNRGRKEERMGWNLETYEWKMMMMLELIETIQLTKMKYNSSSKKMNYDKEYRLIVCKIILFDQKHCISFMFCSSILFLPAVVVVVVVIVSFFLLHISCCYFTAPDTPLYINRIRINRNICLRFCRDWCISSGVCFFFFFRWCIKIICCLLLSSPLT